MGRIPANTITQTPMLLKSTPKHRVSSADLGLGGALRARNINPLIRREEQYREDLYREANAKIRGVSQVLNNLGQSANQMAQLYDRAQRVREDTFLAKEEADYQRYVTQLETGIDANGNRVGAKVYETPYNPGDDSGEGATGATLAFSEAHKKWWDGKQYTPRQAELVARRIQPMQMRVNRNAQMADAAYHERDRAEAHRALSVSKAEHYYHTGDVQSQEEACLTYALAKTPRAEVANLDKWEETGVRDASTLEFTSSGAKSRFDALYKEAHDGMHMKYLCGQLYEAVNTEDDLKSAQIFCAIEELGAVNFLGQEADADFNERLAKAKDERVSMVTRRNRDNRNMAMTLTTRAILGQGTEEEASRLSEIESKLTPEDAHEVQEFRDGFATTYQYGKWEDYRNNAALNQDAKLEDVLKDLTEYVTAMTNPAAKLKAQSELSEMAGKVAGGSDSGTGTKKIDSTTLTNGRRFGRSTSTGTIKRLQEMVAAGAITANQFVAQVDKIREDSSLSVKPERMIADFSAIGVDLSEYFVEAEGVYETKGGKPVLVDGVDEVYLRTYESDTEYADRTEGDSYDPYSGLSTRNNDERELKKRFKIDGEMALALTDLYYEYQTQVEMGMRTKGSVQEYLKERIFQTPAGKAWTDANLSDSITDAHLVLDAEYDSLFSGFYEHLGF